MRGGDNMFSRKYLISYHFQNDNYRGFNNLTTEVFGLFPYPDLNEVRHEIYKHHVREEGQYYNIVFLSVSRIK